MAKAKKLADKDIASFIKKVASAGRGGDTELAFLSASARDLLKKLGGAGTKNPKTGLKEYKAASRFAMGEEDEPMGLFGDTPVVPNTPIAPAASPSPFSVAPTFPSFSMAPDTVTRQAEPEERAPVRGSAAADMQQFNTASTGPSAAQREAERQAQIRAQQEAAQQEAARQAAEQQARERAQQEAARAAEERARQEAAQRAAAERAQQEAARQAAEQQAQARAQQEAAARAAAQEQARLQAEAAMRAQERERAAALINAQGPRFTEQAQIEPESEQVRPQPGSAAADLQQLSGAQGAQPEATQPQATQPPASVPTNLNAAAAAYAAQQERAQQEAARIAAERAQQEEAARVAAVRAQEEEAIRLATAQQAARPQLAPGDRRQDALDREDLYVRPIDSGIGDRPGMGKTGGRPGGFNPYDEEADRRAQEEAARRAAEEEARRAAEQEAARKAAEEEARRKAEEDARRAAEAEAARRAAEEQARRAAEEEAKRRAEQDAAAARAAEEARRLAEENARRAAEEEARRKAEEARKAAEEEARRKAEEERRKKEEEDKKNKPPGGDTGKPGPGTGTTPPGLIDSKLPVSPPPAAAPPPSGGGITFPPATTPPPEKDKPIRTADFIDKNLNGIDDRDEGPSSPPPPEKDKPIRTMDFIDNNRNGIDDRDEKPDRGRPRGEFNFGAIDPNSDIGRLLARIGRPGRGKPGKGGGAPPPQTGGGLPSKPPPTTIPPTAGPPTAGPPTTSPPVTSPPGGGYTPGPIPVTTLPTPGFIANPLPTAPGQGTGTPYFTPTPGSLTPGTIPGNLNLPSLQTSGLPQQALGQNPNLGPGMLGGAENAGYYTDRFGNVILSPGAVKPPGRAKGGPASDKELLALLKGEKKDAYAESLKNFNSARSMLEDLSDMPGETTTEYSSTPISQTIRRATRQPIRQETDRGTARGMAMELESLTAAQEPKRAPDTLAELLKLSESVRSRDAMSAKDLMRDTFGTEKLTKKQLSRLGDLMTRRFAKGGEAKATGELGLFTGLAQKLMESEAFKKMTPLQVRTFLESTQGLPEMRTMPISEKNLDQEEQDKLRSLIEYSENLLTDPTNTYYAGKRRRRYYDTPGQVNYYVHEKFRRSQPGASPFSEGDRSVMPSANLRNTLGNFSFERLPDGTLVVKDAYDFTGDIALEDNALVREAERLGVNRPVEIRLPPKKKAVGGEVKKDTDVKKKEDRTLTPYEVLEGVGTGLATGIGRQVEGTAAMVRDPLGTLEYLRNELETFIKEPEKIPQFVKDSVLERWGQLTSGPQGAGEMLAEFLRLPGGGKGVPKRDIFIGPKAKTWDAESNAQALALEKEGRSPEEIWQATQNFRGADGNWRQEISDDQMFFNVEKFRKSPRFMEVDPLKTRAEDFVRSLGSASMSMYGPRRAKYLFGQLISPTRKPARYEIADFMDYPALENAYPEFAQGLLERSSPFSGTLGQASTGKNLTTLQVPLAYRERGEYDPKRTLVHELQHHIQEKEGWAPGGSPKVWKEQRMGYTPPDFIGDTYRKAQADRADKTLSRKERAQAEQVIKDIEKTYSARNLYQSLMGEAEARAASARTYLTPEERLARPPMMDFDVDFSKQLDLRREGTFPSYYYSGQNPYLEKKE